jgi:hypothetical protein
MAGWDEPSGTSPDPDDWFAAGTSGPLAPPGGQADPSREAGRIQPNAGTAEPDWLKGETREIGVPPPPPAGLPRGRLALLGVVAFAVIVLIAFAASGLFSSSKKSKSPPTTTQRQTSTQRTTTPATTTTPTPAVVPPLPTGLLKQGTTGADVKAVQQTLEATGQSPGTVDGVFGPKTERALIAFQMSAGIPADGVYGPQTKAALEKKLNAG